MNKQQVLRAINNKFVTLYRGPGGGYWYFIYDDVTRNIYETESVYVCKFCDLPAEEWISIGQAVAEKFAVTT